jgi:hypothetical protein
MTLPIEIGLCLEDVGNTATPKLLWILLDNKANATLIADVTKATIKILQLMDSNI